MMTLEEARAFDRFAIHKLGIPGIVLMENAGRGCAETIQSQVAAWNLKVRSVVVLCGPGNNGGDGFVIARHLWNLGWRVRVVLSCKPERYSRDAKTMLFPVLQLPIEVIEFSPELSLLNARDVVTSVGRDSATCIVDALLGTGASGALRSPIDDLVATANAASVRRVAIDLPSGLDAVDGQPASTTFVADLTCTFVDKKSCFGNPAAERFLGFVKVIDIGISRRIQSDLR